jgi:hypothetical protein
VSDFRLLVTGSRSTTPTQAEFIRMKLARLREWLSPERGLIIVQGKCPAGGVDAVAEIWAYETPGVENESHPAEWTKLGKAAGMARNSAMVKLGADMVAAFPGPASRGTWDCLQKAVAAGIEPRLWPLHIYAPESDQ